VPVSGFYEWQSVGHKRPKRPWYITMARSRIMPSAGLWESWTSPEGELVERFTIVTNTYCDIALAESILPSARLYFT